MIHQTKTIDQLAADPDVKKALAQIPRQPAPAQQDPKRAQPELLRAVHHALVDYASGDLRARIEQLKNVHAELLELLEIEQSVARLRDRINRQRDPSLVDDPKMLQIAADELLNHLYTLEDIRKPCRLKAVVRARWAVMAALRNSGYTLTVIGRFLRCDHTAVMHALRRLEGERHVP